MKKGPLFFRKLLRIIGKVIPSTAVNVSEFPTNNKRYRQTEREAGHNQLRIREASIQAMLDQWQRHLNHVRIQGIK